MKRVSPLCLALTFLLATSALFSSGAAQTGTTQNQTSPNKTAQGESRKRGLEVVESPKKQAGQDQSKQRAIDVSATPAPDPNGVGAQSFALVIGISKYKNLPAKAQLQFADEDAKSLRDFLVSPKGGFRPENVILLANEQATWQQIFRDLEQLQNRTGPDSLAFIFFAGHGVVNRSGQGFLLAYDSLPNDLLVTSVEMNRFNSVLRNVRARSTVILSDACHSGAIGDLLNQSGSNEPVASLTAKAFADPSGRGDQSSFIFSAASPSQSSFEIESLKHGLFTYHVLEALEGKADRDGDGLVNAKELYDYVAAQVRQGAERTGGNQVPEFNPYYDRSIPLAFLNEAGMKLYRQWFDTDPIISRTMASFDEALRETRLTKPERDSALFYYNFLNLYPRTPMDVVKLKREELVAKLGASAQSVIDQSPADPALWEEASAWLDTAFELSRSKALRAKQSFCTAMMHHFSGEAARAEKDCDVALGIIEESRLNEPVLCLRVGQFYKRLGRWEKAQRGYKLAVEADPKLEWVSEYADVLIQSNELVEAEAQLRRAQQLDPNYSPGLRLLAEVLLRSDRKERFAEALEIATRAREIKPDDIDTEDTYGWALLRSGDVARAIGPLRKVAQQRLADDKQRDSALFRLSHAYAESGDLSRGISALREAEQRGSQRAGIYDELGRLLEMQGDLPNAIVAAEKAVSLTQSDKSGKSRRLQKVAEYLERTGRLDDAAFKYREASLLATDARVNTSLEHHARALFLRTGRVQDAGLSQGRSSSNKPFSNSYSLLIAPGGRKSLEYLTGVKIDPSNESGALATIFDACLRDPAVGRLLVDFYEKYPELARAVENKGVKMGSLLELPAAGQESSEAAKEAMKFFGIKEKKGGREVNEKEFESKRHILEALGGDSKKLSRGESTSVKFKNDELAILFGMDHWINGIKDAAKARPEGYMLAFLKDEQAMHLYVGLSMLPEPAARWFAEGVVNKTNAKEVAAGIYFAAPYLRFTHEGVMDIPGQSQGTLNWQKVLDTKSPGETLQLIFKRDHGEALYFLMALSAAGEVGNFIARSPLFEQFYRLLKDEKFYFDREPFDLIDLLSYLRVEGEKLRLPKPVELWLLSEQKDADPVSLLLSKIGKSVAGREIPLVRQIAVLSQIQHERPDWLGETKAIEFIAKQVASHREPELEVALDLQMSWPQVENYFARISRIDAISTATLKQTTMRSFQSAFELLRIMSRNTSLDTAKLDALTTRLLETDPGSDRFAFYLVRAFKDALSGVAAPLKGEDVENVILASIANGTPLVLQSQKTDDQPADGAKNQSRESSFYQFDSSKADYDRMASALDALEHTRLRAVIDAIAALEGLEKNQSDTASLVQLKSSVEKFVEPEPPPPPKKGRSKQPVVEAPTLKKTVAALDGSLTPSLLAEVGHQISPFVGEALLGLVYSKMLNPLAVDVKKYSSLVRSHDLGPDPWAGAEFEASKKAGRGNIARLSHVISELEALCNKDLPSAQLMAWLINSYRLVNHRLVTNRAEEFVSRSIDLGDDVLALSIMGDQTAQSVVNRLEEITSSGRAYAVRALLDQAEMKKAASMLSLSELYCIGQRYLKLKLSDDTASNLSDQPGALGALVKIIAQSHENGLQSEISPSLRREVRQFGMTVITRTGLARLDLEALEPFEKSMTFRQVSRLLERAQDFKIALARAYYGQGYSSASSLDQTLAREVIEHLIAESAATTAGRLPPERHWRDILTEIQSFESRRLKALIKKAAGTNHARPLPDLKWTDEVKPITSSSTSPK